MVMSATGRFLFDVLRRVLRRVLSRVLREALATARLRLRMPETMRAFTQSLKNGVVTTAMAAAVNTTMTAAFTGVGAAAEADAEAHRARAADVLDRILDPDVVADRVRPKRPRPQGAALLLSVPCGEGEVPTGQTAALPKPRRPEGRLGSADLNG